LQTLEPASFCHPTGENSIGGFDVIKLIELYQDSGMKSRKIELISGRFAID
jgi:hypothetical protein